MSEVKCSDCGLLAIREADADRRLCEADGKSRDEGVPSHGFERRPFCSVLAAALHAEYTAEKGIDSDHGRYFLAVVTKPRICERFLPWKPGYTPKEHLDSQADAESKANKKAERDEDRKDNWKRMVIPVLVSAIVSFLVGWCGPSKKDSTSSTTTSPTK